MENRPDMNFEAPRSKRVWMFVIGIVCLLFLSGGVSLYWLRSGRTVGTISSNPAPQTPYSTQKIGDVEVRIITLPKPASRSQQVSVANNNYMYTTADDVIIYNGQDVGRGEEYNVYKLSPSGKSYLTTKDTDTGIAVFVNSKLKYVVKRDDVKYPTLSIFSVTDGEDVYEFRVVRENSNPILLNNSPKLTVGENHLTSIVTTDDGNKIAYASSTANVRNAGDYITIGDKKFALVGSRLPGGLDISKNLEHFTAITVLPQINKMYSYILDGQEIATANIPGAGENVPKITVSNNGSTAYYDPFNNYVKTKDLVFPVEKEFQVQFLRLSPEGKSLFYADYYTKSEKFRLNEAVINGTKLAILSQDMDIVGANFQDENIFYLFLAPFNPGS